MLCDYGCGTESNFQLKNGKNCCSKRPAGCEVLKKVNSDATKSVYDLGNRVSAKVRYEAFTQETKDKMAWNRGNYSKTTFVYNGVGNHKAVLLLERGHQCEDCKLVEWKSQPIPLELEHIDGNNKNDIRENLKLLCCNCHALTPTWRGRNKNTGQIKVTDAELISALRACSNIRQALQQVGLSAKGGNYERAKKLAVKLLAESNAVCYNSKQRQCLDGGIGIHIRLMENLSALLEMVRVELVKFGERFKMPIPSEAQ